MHIQYRLMIITEAGGSRCVRTVISRICECVFVCVRYLKEKNSKYQHQI